MANIGKARPKLKVKKGDGLSETDAAKMQRWTTSAGGARIAGIPTLAVWVATKDFDTDKTGRLVAGLYDCDASHGDCVLLERQMATFDQGGFGDDFGRVTLTMAAVDHTFGASRRLVLKVATAEDSEDDLWFAYGTTSYPTHLRIG